jgi:5'-deoxynucleotidase YfbR-like HD superfamily hydrolase
MSKQNDDAQWEIGSFYLANGKPLAKENIDIPVLMNLSNVQRAFSFAGVPPSVNLNLTSHSYLTMLIAYRFLSVNVEFRDAVCADKIAAFAMLHDVAEALVGDIPTPLKHPAFEKFEDKVRESIFEYLGVDITEYNRCYGIVHLADLIASLYECAYATNKGYDLSLIYESRLKKILEECVIDRIDFDNLKCDTKYFRNNRAYLCYYPCDDGTFCFKVSRGLITEFIEEIVGCPFPAKRSINNRV